MDTSPTALFDSYEQEYWQFIDTIRTKLEDSVNDHKGGAEQRGSTLRRVEMDLDEADEMVSQMEIEIQGVPQSVRPQYQTRLRSAKTNLSEQKKLLVESRSRLARSALLSSTKQSGNDAYGSSDDPYGSSDRVRLLAGTTLLENGVKRLQQSQQMVLETENQGAEILSTLRIQREQIENSRNTLQRADIATDRASGTLKSMIRRMYQQRVITGAIVSVLIVLIIIIVWEKIAR